MTHNTDAEREGFEELAKKRGWSITPHGTVYDSWGTQQAWDAWKAARRAPSAAVPQNEAYSLIDRFLRNNLDDGDYAEYSAALDSLIAAPQPPEAAPVQAAPMAATEIPVRGYLASHSGKLHPDAGKIDAFESAIPLVSQHDHLAACALLSAQERKPLTDEEIGRIVMGVDVEIAGDIKILIRAIERAHNIK